MEIEDVMSLPANSPGNGSENDEGIDYGCESSKVDLQAGKVEVGEAEESGEIVGSSGDTSDGNNQLLLASDNDKTVLDNPPSLEVSFELKETVTETRTCSSSVMHAVNGCLAMKDESFLSNHKEDGFAVHGREIGEISTLFAHFFVLFNSKFGIQRP